MEIKRTLDGRELQFACDVVERTDDSLVVLYRVQQDVALHGLTLPAGTVTVGYFWTDRPFNLYHWVGPEGHTLAYYFNVGDVVRYEPRVLEWYDLAVDILATPEGRVDVLDEDELPDDLDPELRVHILAARDRVLDELPALTARAEQRSTAMLAHASDPAL